MSNSFYGEKVYGAFIIEKYYSTIPEMCEDFALGEQCTVNYESYVLINTTNRDHNDNGKLFRRGFDFNNQQRTIEYHDENGTERTCAANGAEYIGTIVGPPGPAPNVVLKNLDEVDSENLLNVDLVPGKTEDGKYNDSIIYKWKSEVDNESTQATSILTLGTQIPYLVNEFEAQKLAYGSEDQLITRVDSKTHPFYNKWKISLPEGQPGKSIKDVYLWVNDTNADVTYDNNKVVHKKQSALLYTLEDNTIHFIKYYNPLEEVKFGDDGHLLARYASQYAEDYTGKATQTVDNKIWVDLGKVLNYNGIYIQGAVTDSSVPTTQEGIIQYLNTNASYAGGLNGKAIVVRDSIYAYDYNNSTWFRIGNGLGSAYARPETATPANDQYLNGMNEQGLWFVIDTYN